MEPIFYFLNPFRSYKDSKTEAVYLSDRLQYNL